jgi:hypothetical protein
MSFKEYKLSVPWDDYMGNLVNTKALVSQLMRGFIRLVGPVRVRITIDAVMERFIEPISERDAGFRATFKTVRSESEIPSAVAEMISQIENAVDHYNANGMSGCRLGKIKGVRVMAVRL